MTNQTADLDKVQEWVLDYLKRRPGNTAEQCAAEIGQSLPAVLIALDVLEKMGRITYEGEKNES